VGFVGSPFRVAGLSLLFYIGDNGSITMLPGIVPDPVASIVIIVWQRKIYSFSF